MNEREIRPWAIGSPFAGAACVVLALYIVPEGWATWLLWLAAGAWFLMAGVYFVGYYLFNHWFRLVVSVLVCLITSVCTIVHVFSGNAIWSLTYIMITVASMLVCWLSSWRIGLIEKLRQEEHAAHIRSANMRRRYAELLK